MDAVINVIPMVSERIQVFIMALNTFSRFTNTMLVPCIFYNS